MTCFILRRIKDGTFVTGRQSRCSFQSVIRNLPSSSFSFFQDKLLHLFVPMWSCVCFFSDPAIIHPPLEPHDSLVLITPQSRDPFVLPPLLLIFPETLILCLKSSTKRLTQRIAPVHRAACLAGMWATSEAAILLRTRWCLDLGPVSSWRMCWKICTVGGKTAWTSRVTCFPDWKKLLM